MSDDVCYFCSEPLQRDEHGEYTEGIAEISSRHLPSPPGAENSVMIHTDCTDFDAIAMNEDPDWVAV